MPSTWPRLLRTAQAVVATTIARLPDELRSRAEPLAVTYESWPNDALIDEGWDPDLLGMFVGDPVGVESQDAAPVPPQIILYLENLWDCAEADEAVYRDEVRITYLHELGHYLGLDEEELD